MKKKIVVFTGAGVSAESGVKTFRDNGGLWNDYKVEEVASIDGWNNDPQKVIDFYNLRKNEMKNVVPNDAHKLIAKLEETYDVTIITQNVDDLHEKAGSTNVIHIHGELSKLRSELDSDTKKEFVEDLKLGDVCDEGGQFRPDIVWFGEDLDFMKMHNAKVAASECIIFIIVGTSMKVAPANMIPFSTKETCIIYYVDPSELDFQIPKSRKSFFYHIKNIASIGMKEVIDDINQYL